MNGEQMFWFILATENLIAAILAVLYYWNYRREAAALAAGIVWFLYSAWFILQAGILKSPEGWQTAIGVALLAALPMLIVLLAKRVMWGDD